MRKSARLSPNAPGKRFITSSAAAPTTPLPEIYEIAEDETSPEIHDIADRRLKKWRTSCSHCQQNETEKHGKSREVQRHIETETRRAIWCFVEEIYRGWTVSLPRDMVETSVNGILGVSNDFWDEDEEDEDGPPEHSRRGAGNGWRSFSICSRKMFGYVSSEMGTNFRSHRRWCIRRQGCLQRRCGRPVHYVRHVSDEIEVTSSLGQEIERWTQEW